MSQTVALNQMLEARERRAFRQWELLQQFRLPLICFTMNIAGPIKNSDLIREGFRLGNRLLRQQLAREKRTIVHFEQIDEVTGNEACYVIDADPVEIKAITTAIEDNTQIGRLFDMDVLVPGGRKVERGELSLSDRRCLICGGPARECARSRTHSVPELQEKTFGMLRRCVDQEDASRAAELACRALLYEVCTTPKPGLVDRRNSGSHRDMDIFSFMSSASALWPYFETCCHIGRETADAPAPQTFAALRWPGKEAEGRMLAATGNVNTHKGAIFSLGILCGALGRLSGSRWSDSAAVLAEAAAMTAGLTEGDFAGVTEENARTVGQKLFALYGITGVRGQAEAGFPAVGNVGLPVLEGGLARGLTPDAAGSAAMLAMLSAAVDTNLVARSDVQTQRRTAEETARLLEAEPYPDEETLIRMDEAFIRKNLSPGGSADLLALCYFLHFCKEEP